MNNIPENENIGVEQEPDKTPVTESAEPSEQVVSDAAEQTLQNENGAVESPAEYTPINTTYPKGDDNRYYQNRDTIRFTPVTAAPAPKTANVGLRVFLGIVAAVTVICICITGGYIAGRELNLTSESKTPIGVVSKPEDEGTLTPNEIYNAVSPGVVGIIIYNSEGEQGNASGVVMSADGYIITNDHIYSETPNARFVIITSDGREYDARYIAGDTRSDLAVLKADVTGLTPVQFGNSNEAVVGESALAIGYPGGAYEKAILTVGYISSTGRRVTSSTTSYSTKFIQTDSAINPGSSGGALVNSWGQVIGITSSKIAGSAYDSVGFAIPSNSVVEIANLLVEHGYVKGRARLGISYTVNSTVLKKIDKSIVTGLLIHEITDECPLKNTDVKAGDVIVAVNDNPVTRGEDVLEIIESKKAGDSLMLTVYRTELGTTKTYTVALLEDKGSSSYVLTGGSDTTQIG